MPKKKRQQASAAELARRRDIKREEAGIAKVLPVDQIRVTTVVPFEPKVVYTRKYNTKRGTVTRFYVKGTIPSGETATRSVNKPMAAGIAAALGNEQQAIRIYDELNATQKVAAAKAATASSPEKKAMMSKPRVIQQKKKFGIASLEEKPGAKKKAEPKVTKIEKEPTFPFDLSEFELT